MNYIVTLPTLDFNDTEFLRDVLEESKKQIEPFVTCVLINMKDMGTVNSLMLNVFVKYMKDLYNIGVSFDFIGCNLHVKETLDLLKFYDIKYAVDNDLPPNHER